jgi:hypothetical protein
MKPETTSTPGRIIHMEAHQFETINRIIINDPYKEYGSVTSAQFIEHPEDKENAFCLN